MKYLVKNFFAGFVCSVLLVGCQGQDLNVYNNEPNVTIQDTSKTIYEDTIDIMEKYKAVNDFGISDTNDINYLKSNYKHDTQGFTFTITMNAQPLYPLKSQEELTDFINVVFLSEGLNIYKELVKVDYFDKYDTFVFAYNVIDNGTEGNLLFCTFSEDKMIKVTTENGEMHTMTLTIEGVEMLADPQNAFGDNDYSEPVVEQEPQIQHQQPGVNPLPELNYHYPEQDTNLTYYSETLDGKSVFNVHIDNDSVQTADIRDYVWQYGEAAMGIDYIVFQFPDGNAVVDNNTLDVYFHQDLNYYRN